MDVVYTWITVRKRSNYFFSAKPSPSSGHEVMSLAFFFIHLMDTVYSGELYCLATSQLGIKTKYNVAVFLLTC